MTITDTCSAATVASLAIGTSSSLNSDADSTGKSHKCSKVRGKKDVQSKYRHPMLPTLCQSRSQLFSRRRPAPTAGRLAVVSRESGKYYLCKPHAVAGGTRAEEDRHQQQINGEGGIPQCDSAKSSQDFALLGYRTSPTI